MSPIPCRSLAAGTRLVYVAQEVPSPSAQALVVKADSAIRSVADLKGKRVAVAKAAGAFFSEGLLPKKVNIAVTLWKPPA